MPGAPDLAVEVVSPKDSSADTLARVRDYLSAGTEEVWVVYPQQREVHQYRRDIEPETVRVYKNDERIDAESLFPGLELITSAFFVLPDWVEQD